MYLWIIIATFIAALAAMGTSLRPDIKHLYVEPRAQSIVTKIYTQHRGMVKYAYQNSHNGQGGGPSYVMGDWNPDNHPAYVPYGFNANSGMAQFTSKIYCVDKTSPGHSSTPMDCIDYEDILGFILDPDPLHHIKPGANRCAGSNVITYLVTFGRVPQKWQDVRTGKPNAALLNAMQDTLGYINGFGYTISRYEYKGHVVQPAEEGQEATYENIYNILDTPTGILGHGSRPYTPLPRCVINDSSFKSVCENQHCLIYMSSI